jgi:hypothetical protein
LVERGDGAVHAAVSCGAAEWGVDEYWGVERKAFFFEKKKQKTGEAVPGRDPGIHAVVAHHLRKNNRAPMSSAIPAEPRGCPGQARARAPRGAPGFLVLFFKKELLS